MCRGQGFADLREGCQRGRHWRCHLMRVRVGIRSIISIWISIFPQIALAIGVLTSSWGVRVHRFCGFVPGGGCDTGSRWRCRLVCVGVRVRSSKTGLFGYIILYLYFGLFLAQKYIYGRRSILWIGFFNKWQKIADTFPFYLGSMLVFPFKKEKTWSGVSSRTAMGQAHSVYFQFLGSQQNKTCSWFTSPWTPLAPREGASKPHKCTKGLSFCPPGKRPLIGAAIEMLLPFLFREICNGKKTTSKVVGASFSHLISCIEAAPASEFQWQPIRHRWRRKVGRLKGKHRRFMGVKVARYRWLVI